MKTLFVNPLSILRKKKNFRQNYVWNYVLENLGHKLCATGISELQD